MTIYYMPDKDLLELFPRRTEMPVIAAEPTEQLTWLGVRDNCPSLDALRQPRSAQSPKGFFLPPTESMGLYGSGDTTATSVETQRRVLLGALGCELRARNYLDQVMLKGEFNDPAYQTRRDATLIVSVDCVDCTASCFCTSVGGNPFAEEGYDINLTPLPDGFLVDVATEPAMQWLGEEEMQSRAEATPEQLTQREQVRKDMIERLRKQNSQFSFSASDQNQPALPQENDQAWGKFAADCVECGACTNICPTCHCFYLYDQNLSELKFERVRTWDSCLLSTYHRMAGGESMKLSARAALLSRLANRVLHKFTYSPEQYDLLGCVGCGRCIDACLGDIDIRQVVEELQK